MSTSASTWKDLKREMDDQLASWRDKLAELKQEAGLAKLRTEHEVAEVKRDFDRAYAGAKRRLEDSQDEARSEWSAISGALEAGWNELRDSYRELKSSPRSEG